MPATPVRQFAPFCGFGEKLSCGALLRRHLGGEGSAHLRIAPTSVSAKFPPCGRYSRSDPGRACPVAATSALLVSHAARNGEQGALRPPRAPIRALSGAPRRRHFCVTPAPRECSRNGPGARAHAVGPVSRTQGAGGSGQFAAGGAVRRWLGGSALQGADGSEWRRGSSDPPCRRPVCCAGDEPDHRRRPQDHRRA